MAGRVAGMARDHFTRHRQRALRRFVAVHITPLANNGPEGAISSHPLCILVCERCRTSNALAAWTGAIIGALIRIKWRCCIADEIGGGDRDIEDGMGILALFPLGAKTAQVIPTQNFFRVAVPTFGTVLAEPPGIPRTILDFHRWINMQKITVTVCTMGEEMANGHVFNIKDMQKITRIALFAEISHPVFAHDRFRLAVSVRAIFAS